MDLRAVAAMCAFRRPDMALKEREGTRSHFARRPRRGAALQGGAVARTCRREVFGPLVALGFGVAAFTPAPYRRAGLARPLDETSS